MKSSKGEGIRRTRASSEIGAEMTEPELAPSFLMTRSVHFAGLNTLTPSSRFRSFSIDPFYEFPVVSTSQSTEIDDKKTANSTVSAAEMTKVARSSLKDVLTQMQEQSPFPSDISPEEQSLDPFASPSEVREETKRPTFVTIFDSKCSLFTHTEDETIQSNEEALYTASSIFRTFEEQKYGEMIEEGENEESVAFFRSTEALKLAMRREATEEDGEDPSMSFADEPPHGSAICFFPPGATASKNRLSSVARPSTTHLQPKILDTTFLATIPDIEVSVDAPDSASPICRKLIICQSTSNCQVEVCNIWPCSGFRTTLKLEFSDVVSLNKATFQSDQSEGFVQLLTVPIMSLFSPAKVRWLSSGFEHCCVVVEDGSVFTWGSGGSGCLGHGDTLSQIVPRRLVAPRMHRLLYLECGAYHNAAVNEQGELWTWGRGDVHQLGVSQSRLTKDSVGFVALVPVLVEELHHIKAVACGEAHTLALDRDGHIFSFGWAEEGQLGLPLELTEDGQTSAVVHIPKLAETKAVKVSAGALFSVCITDTGQLFVWGNGELGQLGLGPEVRFLAEPHPNPAFDQVQVLDVLCGESSVICLTVSGKVYGWGKGLAGKFATGRFDPGTDLIRCSPMLLEEADIAHKIVVPRNGEEDSPVM